MIYLSSSCFKEDSVKTCIEACLDHNCRNIELSGNIKYEKNFLETVLNLKKKFSLNILLHNYSPRPKKDFVLNLSSLDKKIFNMSMKHCHDSIMISKIIGSNKFSFHSGFYLDPDITELGKNFSSKKLNNLQLAIEKFKRSLNTLKIFAKKNKINLYYENNVLTKKNYNKFNKTNPFMFVDKKDYISYLKEINLFPLIDIGHLKVSCKTLKRNLDENFYFLSKLTDYFHISDNDGYSDLNNSVVSNSKIFKLLNSANLKSDNTITLEIRNSKNLKEDISLIKSIIQ